MFRMRRQVGQRNVLGNRQVEQDAGELAVLRHEEDAVRHRIGGRSDIERFAVQRDAAAEPLVDAEQNARKLGASGANQTGKAEDFATPEFQVDRVVGIGAGAHRADRERDAARRAPGFGRLLALLQHAPDHQLDHLVVVDLALGQRAGKHAVAQHNDAVGDALDLMQAVRDEDDADAFRPQPLDHVEQLFGLGDRQAGGRLVEDHQPR
ncbi:hypothetical protein AU467_21295 [Mesorhizobium loti]|uniref:Uncharacterized protein n=1 Tax=Rhizobium loti TaxID=381 RepID=A0A101KT77_RHILI|nr:hypothetical protein AU467_21295 [Mesorhizobium loti]